MKVEKIGSIVYLPKGVMTNIKKISVPYCSYCVIFARTPKGTKSSIMRYPSNGGSGSKLKTNSKILMLTRTLMNVNTYSVHPPEIPEESITKKMM